MSESDIQDQIRLALGREPDVRLFRNNVGVGWCGRLVSSREGRVVLDSARPVTFGLMPGSGDLIGWRSVVVTSDMVGQRVALFVSGECKAPRGPTFDAQMKWRAAVIEAGGLADLWRSPEDAKRTTLLIP